MMDAYDGLSTTKNVDRLLVVPYGYSTWKATQRYQEQQQCITGEPDTWKLVSPVRRGDVEKGQYMHLVSALLYHFAHRERQDNRHSLKACATRCAGTYPTGTALARIFFASEFTCHLDRSGYIRFRRWRISAEEGLAKQQVQVSIYTSTRQRSNIKIQSWPFTRWSGRRTTNTSSA